MAKILYAGQAIALPENADVEGLAALLQDSYSKGGHSWVTFDLPGEQPKQMKLLFGPGIPVGFVVDGHDDEAIHQGSAD
jgi:hypothetical protein